MIVLTRPFVTHVRAGGRPGSAEAGLGTTSTAMTVRRVVIMIVARAQLSRRWDHWAPGHLWIIVSPDAKPDRNDAVVLAASRRSLIHGCRDPEGVLIDAGIQVRFSA